MIYKCLIPILFICSLFSFMDVKGESLQDKSGNGIIVLMSLDTLKNIEILKNKRNTNNSKVTFIQNDKKHVLTANEVLFYQDDEAYCESHKVAGSTEMQLVSIMIEGPLTLAYSRTIKGEFLFFVKKKDSDAFINLDPHRNNLKAFFVDYLQDTEQFYDKNKINIYYEYASLGKFVSTYNAYREPSVFKVAKYPSPETGSINAYASVNMSSFKFKGDDESFNLAPSFSLGARFDYKYSRVIALNTLVYFDKASFTSPKSEVNINSIAVEPSLNFSFKGSSNAGFTFGTGLGLMYVVKSNVIRNQHHLNEKPQFGLNKFALGLTLNSAIAVGNKYDLVFIYSKYNMATENVSIVEGSWIKKIDYSSFKLGFIYKL